MQTYVTLLIPGLNGSSETHWQSVWEREQTGCVRANLGAWRDPTPQLWVERLEREIARQTLPVVLVAHSLGCIATVMWEQQSSDALRRKVKGALLVAPCDPEHCDAVIALRRFTPLPSAPLGFRSIVVASSDDPYATLDRSRAFADNWGSTFVSIGAAGHINARSNLGAWRYGQALVDALVQEAPQDAGRPPAAPTQGTRANLP